MATARRYDHNGWFEVRENPISKVGVFPYLGRSLGAEYEPDRIYNVLRPAEELSDPETIDSFKMIPLVDDHEMLGENGTSDAEDYGVHGTLGESVVFRDGTLYSNIKVFSREMADKIDRKEKVELSCGYFCEYEKANGVFNGEPYEVIQRKIRGNHIALVEEGRMGSEVRVLDHMDHAQFALDSAEFVKMSKKRKLRAGLDANDVLAQLAAVINGAMVMDESEDETETNSDEDEEATDAEIEVEATGDAGEDPEAGEDEGEDPEAAGDEGEDPEAGEDEDEPAKGEDRAVGLDMSDVFREMGARDRLAKQLFPAIGAFDASEMRLGDVARYGARKLGLKNVPKGQERAAVEAYLLGRKSARPATVATDAAPARSPNNPVGAWIASAGKKG